MKECMLLKMKAIISNKKLIEILDIKLRNSSRKQRKQRKKNERKKEKEIKKER